jgi:hypothetical protein
MTATRLAQLDTLKFRLRQIVFEGGERGEKATKLLRTVRERIIEAEAPARAVAEKAATAERKAWATYKDVALSEDTERPRAEMEAHERVATLCGGMDRAFRLLRLLGETRDERVRQVMETEDEFSARIAQATARKARAEGYSAEAVRALLAVQ